MTIIAKMLAILKLLTIAINIVCSVVISWEQERQFVSNVSHELRTPLTVVSGYIQSLLRRSTNLNDYQKEALETAASEADRTVRLLQYLLDLARADSGHTIYRRDRVNLNELVAEVAGMAEQFSNRMIHIEAPEIVFSVCDRDRLKQVLVNLIDNAVKFVVVRPAEFRQ